MPHDAETITFGLRVVDAHRELGGGEPAEDHRVHRAEPRAGQHRDDGLGHHRHVDDDPVALAPRPAPRSTPAKRATSVEQLGVGERALACR